MSVLGTHFTMLSYSTSVQWVATFYSAYYQTIVTIVFNITHLIWYCFLILFSLISFTDGILFVFLVLYLLILYGCFIKSATLLRFYFVHRFQFNFIKWFTIACTRTTNTSIMIAFTLGFVKLFDRPHSWTKITLPSIEMLLILFITDIPRSYQIFLTAHCILLKTANLIIFA